MTSERKPKRVRKSNKFSPGCLVAIGVMLGCAISLFWADLKYGGSPFDPKDELRSVMETYYFANGLAEFTGDTSILENVVTESGLQSKIEHCKKGLCNGSHPPHAIGEYFKVVNLTEEFAVIELEQRPVITDLDKKPGSYLKYCFSLLRDGDNWRVDGMYFDCDRYLPDKYK